MSADGPCDWALNKCFTTYREDYWKSKNESNNNKKRRNKIIHVERKLKQKEKLGT